MKDDLPALIVLDEPPVLMTSESDPQSPEQWRLDAYFSAEPSARDIALLQDLVPSAGGIAAKIEQLDEQDWVTLSQRELEPIRAGRFYVHTSMHRHGVPAGSIAFEIDAGRAFGTGHHDTTAGCLAALDRLKRGGASFGNILDLGTGSGLLAFAALRLWPAARCAASDVDPVSIEVTRDNARVNGVRLGRARGQVELAVAAGVDHPRLRTRAPYDLVIANILAGPLIELARPITDALEAGGQLILAGLLRDQIAAVTQAYRRCDMMLVRLPDRRAEWPILELRKRRCVVRSQRTR